MSIQKILIGNSIVATIEGKQYWKSFTNIDKAVTFYQELEGLQPTDIVKALAPEQSSNEKQLSIEYNEKLESAKAIGDILDFMKDIRDNGHDFLEVKNNSIYLQGINISMPELLVRAMVTTDDDEELESLKNFWSLCAMNPDPRARFDLFEHLRGGKLSITTTGLFVAYKNVDIKEFSNKDLSDFIVKTWIHTKAVTKKSPSNYLVWKSNGEYQRVSLNNSFDKQGELIGNLEDLYQGLDKIAKTTYTDNYTGKMNIEIGKPVKQDRTKCDSSPDSSCSKGLHVGNKSFLKKGHFGEEGLVVLINPMDVVAVPNYNQDKMRVCEYLPIGIADYDDENDLIELDAKSFEYDVLSDVMDKLKSIDHMQFEEYKTYEFISPEATIDTLSNIYDRIFVSREDANDTIRNRCM